MTTITPNTANRSVSFCWPVSPSPVSGSMTLWPSPFERRTSRAVSAETAGTATPNDPFSQAIDRWGM